MNVVFMNFVIWLSLGNGIDNTVEDNEETIKIGN